MSDVVVVDTSIAVKWVVTEPDTPVALALVAEWNRNGVDLVAPALFASEITNVLYKRVRKGELTVAEAGVRLRQVFLAVPALDFSPDPAVNLALSMRALELARQHGLPATYDAHYLALAEREGCEYWTADERLWNAVRAPLPWVRWLGELSAPAAAPPLPPTAP